MSEKPGSRPRADPAETERCASCLQTYAYEVELRCAECDHPMCPFCVVRIGAWRLACPDCGPSPRRVRSAAR